MKRIMNVTLVAPRVETAGLKPSDEHSIEDSLAGGVHQWIPQLAKIVAEAGSDVRPGIDQERRVEVSERLFLVTLLEEPDTRIDSPVSVQQIERSTARGVADMLAGRSSRAGRCARAGRARGVWHRARRPHRGR